MRDLLRLCAYNSERFVDKRRCIVSNQLGMTSKKVLLLNIFFGLGLAWTCHVECTVLKVLVAPISKNFFKKSSGFKKLLSADEL